MGFKSLTRIDNIELSWRGGQTLVQAGGRVVAVGRNDRPVQILLDSKTACYVSLKPIYYNGATVTVAETTANSAMDGITHIKVREIIYRDPTDERSSWVTEWDFPSLAGGKNIVITSNATVISTELYVTHREFYVSYEDFAPGVFYLWQRIAYTGGTDSTVADGKTFDVLVEGRELESGGETGQFPAVGSAAYAFGRLWGTGMGNRVALNMTITLTNGSPTATLTGSPDFDEADVYRAIVYIGPNATIDGQDYVTGQKLAFVKLVIDPKTALLEFAQGFGVNVWSLPTLTLVNGADVADCQFSFNGRSESDLFVTPVYAGETGGGLSNGLFTWSPLGTVRDQQTWQSAGKAIWIKSLAGQLIVGFQKAVVVFTSQYSTDLPPISDSYALSEEIGTFNPTAVWADSDRILHFFSQGRIYSTSGNRIVDESLQGGWASFARKFLGIPGSTTQNSYASWNAERNAVLIGNLRSPVNPDSFYTLYVSFDANPATLHPMSLPAQSETGFAVPREVDGVQFNQWVLLMAKHVVLFAAPGVFTDQVANGATPTAIPWEIFAGKKLMDWSGTMKRLEIVYASGGSDLGVNFVADVYPGADVNAPVTGPQAPETKVFTADDVAKSLIHLNVQSGRALSYQLSGFNNSRDGALLRIRVWVQQESANL